MEFDEDIIYSAGFWILTLLGWAGALLSFAAITGSEKLSFLTNMIGGQELVEQYTMPIYIKIPILIAILVGVPAITYFLSMKGR